MALPDKTIHQVGIWKNEPLQRFCVALVATAVELWDRGIKFVGSDDVPEDRQPPSTSISGCAVSKLRAANILEDFFDDISELKIARGRRISKRASANGRKISLYKLTSRALAVEFLARNGITMDKEPVQMDLFTA